MMVKDVLFSQFGWWIQFILTLVMLGLAIFQFIKLYIGKSNLIKKTNINAVLLLGVANAALGITCQILGIVLALEAIIEAADVSPQIIINGFMISFYTTIYGFFVFLISAVLWYVNKIKWELNSK